MTEKPQIGMREWTFEDEHRGLILRINQLEKVVDVLLAIVKDHTHTTQTEILGFPTTKETTRPMNIQAALKMAEEIRRGQL